MLTQHYRPAMRRQHHSAQHLVKLSTLTYVFILIATIFWCIAIVLPPFLLSEGGTWGVMGIVLYQPFHTICHQLPERTLHVLGLPLAVCMRCTAIYFGFLFGTLLYLPLRSFGVMIAEKRFLLLSLAIPMMIDVVLDEIGIHSSTAATRLMTGSFFGVVIPFYVIPAAQEAVQQIVAASRLFTSTEVKKGSFHA